MRRRVGLENACARYIQTRNQFAGSQMRPIEVKLMIAATAPQDRFDRLSPAFLECSLPHARETSLGRWDVLLMVRFQREQVVVVCVEGDEGVGDSVGGLVQPFCAERGQCERRKKGEERGTRS